MLGNQATFAYTGLSRCGVTESTEALLTRCLAEPAALIARKLDHLGKEAARSIRNLPFPCRPSERRAIRRTSFVGAGYLGINNPRFFGRMPSADKLHPFLAVVSNAQGITEEWRAEADQEFSISLKLLEQDELFGLHAAGQRFDSSERLALERGIRRCLGRITQPGLGGAFNIAAVDGRPDAMHVDSVEGITVEKSAVVRKAGIAFDLVRGDALPRWASRDLTLKVAEERWTA